MVKEAVVMLADETREAGRRLLELLDLAQMEISDAFWHLVEEEQAWRLVLATPLAYRQGAIELYTRVRAALDLMTEEEKAGLRLRDTAVVTPDDSVVQMMRHSYDPIGQRRGQRLHRMNVITDEPFIYRLAADGTN